MRLTCSWPVIVEILKSSDFLKNKIKLRTLESRNLIPFFIFSIEIVPGKKTVKYIKTKSIRKLSNLNFQWTKTL